MHAVIWVLVVMFKACRPQIKVNSFKVVGKVIGMVQNDWDVVESNN